MLSLNLSQILNHFAQIGDLSQKLYLIIFENPNPGQSSRNT